MDPRPVTSPSPDPVAPRPRVFLSYARMDYDLAQAIVEALEKAGVDVDWDVQGLHAGDAFAAVIAGWIERADAVLVLWSEHSVKSAWVFAETDSARIRGKRLVPFRLAPDVVPPLPFSGLHTMTLVGSTAERAHQVAVEVTRVLSLPPPPPKRPVPSPKVIGLVALALMGLVVVLVAVVPWPKPDAHADIDDGDGETPIEVVDDAMDSSSPTNTDDASGVSDAEIETLPDVPDVEDTRVEVDTGTSGAITCRNPIAESPESWECVCEPTGRSIHVVTATKPSRQWLERNKHWRCP